MYQKKLNYDVVINLDDIDRQHRVILSFIDKLKNARHDNSELRALVTEVRAHIVSHFRMEEALLEKAGYEFVRAHKKVHELINKRLADIHQRFKEDKDVAEDLRNLLQNWFYNHIQNDDAAYMPTVTAYLFTAKSTPYWQQWWNRLVDMLSTVLKFKDSDIM